MTMTADISMPRAAAAVVRFRRRQIMALAVPAVILAYLAYVVVAFDLAGLADRARLDNARILVADSYSYKTHVTRDNRSGGITIAVEGEAKGTWPAGQSPDWVTLTGTDGAVISLPRGHLVEIAGDVTRVTVPGYGVITLTPTAEGVGLDLPGVNPGADSGADPGAAIPRWINASPTRVMITTAAGRISMTRARTEVFRYALGWELFWFTLDSPFYGKSPGTLARLALSSDPVVAGRSNIGAMLHDIWNNQMWRHKDVVWAIFETMLMAFLGTMGAALVALPLAFLAARNFRAPGALRFALRRLFDVLRGVDGLIWTIILSRAFGPGPLTGALAILITDTGGFGKMFSEALENVDDRQIEGVRSTGASALQRYRFGVMPQIMPILASQVLYYLESNTRSATVIGAITGGGIGLLLTQAIITQKDWEEVSYYIMLIVLMVMVMDTLSGWLRRRLIKGDGAGH
jgi:phosphonate transport system permease protein